MTYETLHKAMTDALKAGRKDEKNALAGFIAQIQKTAIDKGCRDNITEDLVNAELLKIKKSIQEEMSGGFLEDFIRKFVDEIIVSKIDEDRHNIKLDIYLNLFGRELSKIKGARHIDGSSDDILYLENQTCNTIEAKRTIDNRNRFIYNVYVESL